MSRQSYVLTSRGYRSHLLWQDGRSSAYMFRYRPPTPRRISQRNGYDTISCLSMLRCSGRSLYLSILCKPRPQRLFGERLYRTDLKVARAAENTSRAVWRLTPVGYHQRLLTIKKAVSEQNRGFDSSRRASSASS